MNSRLRQSSSLIVIFAVNVVSSEMKFLKLLPNLFFVITVPLKLFSNSSRIKYNKT